MLYNDFRSYKQQNKYVNAALLLLLAIAYSGLDYLFKHYYSVYGDVPFYRFDYHLIFIAQWLATPLATYPFVKYFSPKKQHSYLLIAFGCLLLSFLVSIFIYVLVRIIYFGKYDIPPFGQILLNGLDRAVAIGFPATFVFLGYFYMTKSARQRKIIDDAEKAMVESKIQQLNAGFEPHFLFNNLNILSELVEKDVVKSQQFIHALASLYHYIVTTNKQSIISLNDELVHAQNYLDILNIKFNHAYVLNIEMNPGEKAFVLTNTMQVLIENVVKHNAASCENPLTIFVTVNDSELIVTNEKRKRETALFGSAHLGLDNLKQRYLLTFDKSVGIQEDENTFSVIVPVVKE